MKAFIGLGFLGLAIAGVVGWVLNIVAFFHLLSGPVTALFIARIVGIFVAPLGAVLGWIS